MKNEANNNSEHATPQDPTPLAVICEDGRIATLISLLAAINPGLVYRHFGRAGGDIPTEKSLLPVPLSQFRFVHRNRGSDT